MMVKFADVLLSPDVSISRPVIVYVAPGSRLVSKILGPPAPALLVVVNKLCVPVNAAAVLFAGALAPLNDVHP